MSDKILQGPLTKSIKKNEILFRAQDSESDLYIIHSGKLMVCLTEGSKVTPLAYLEAGEYLGELSFFDSKQRSAHVICIEDASIIQIPVSEIEKQMPKWLTTVAKDMTSKVRLYDEAISKQGIRRKNAQTIQALDAEDQKYYLELLRP